LQRKLGECINLIGFGQPAGGADFDFIPGKLSSLDSVQRC
jgi:hypothetical protein